MQDVQAYTIDAITLVFRLALSDLARVFPFNPRGGVFVAPESLLRRHDARGRLAVCALNPLSESSRHRARQAMAADPNA